MRNYNSCLKSIWLQSLGIFLVLIKIGVKAECPPLGLYQYYLNTADCDTVSSPFTPSYAWDFRVDVESSTGPIDSISGLTSTYENGLTSSMTMGAYFAGGGNSDGAYNCIDLEGFEVGGTCSFEAYVRYDGSGHSNKIFDFVFVQMHKMIEFCLVLFQI